MLLNIADHQQNKFFKIFASTKMCVNNISDPYKKNKLRQIYGLYLCLGKAHHF